ncbi:MAG: histone acetyltransferase, partial [Raoultibacter sp.]
METLLLEILKTLRESGTVDTACLERLIRKHNKNITENKNHHAKKKLLPYYLQVKATDHARWAAWQVDAELERQLFGVLQIKPRRTASGVATITVLTKPWKCASNCLYCPNDVLMPKSYLSDEPACQRAQRSYFDPYLQVATRLHTLQQMGHTTDKVEVIILGGTWSDYDSAYQIWFVSELFRALNEGDGAAASEMQKRRAYYQEKGISDRKEDLLKAAEAEQRAVNDGRITYNQAWSRLYEHNARWKSIAADQVADVAALEAQQL